MRFSYVANHSRGESVMTDTWYRRGADFLAHRSWLGDCIGHISLLGLHIAEGKESRATCAVDTQGGVP